MTTEPTATGNLQATPLGHLLVYLLDRGLSGTLVLEESGGNKHAIYFEAGAPAKVKTSDPVVYLGQVLVETRAITREVYEQTLSAALRTRKLHGQGLLEAGFIELTTLKAALRDQLARQVMWLFKLSPATLYGYYDGVNFLERWGAPQGVRVKPLALIWRGLRRHATPGEVEALLARLGQRVIELHVDAPIRRFSFESAEHTLIDVLRAKPQTITELLSRGLAPPDDVKRLVYALMILRQLEFGSPDTEPVGVDEAPSSSRLSIRSAVSSTSLPEFEPRPSTPIPSASPEDSERRQRSARASIPDGGRQMTPTPLHAVRPSSPPSRRPPTTSSLPPVSPLRYSSAPPDVQALRSELETLASQSRGSHYETLGVARDATPTVIQHAFFALAKKWHPDRLRPELADLKDQATRLFARISEANQVLGDPERRQTYDEVVGASEGVDEHEQVQRVLRATNAFQKAEVLVKRGNLAQAEQEARLALEQDPTQADHIALFAWIIAQKPDADMKDILVRLERAAKTEPNNTRVRWYRGQLLKRLGREREAAADFRFILERDPKHVDAHREIRLYMMRKGTRTSDPPRTKSDPAGPAEARRSLPPAASKPGLLGKFFKKP